MTAELQARCVAALTERIATLASGPYLLAPKAVRPYGGELLQPSTINVEPVVYVELDEGTLARPNDAASWRGDHTLGLIAVTRHGAGITAQAHDGARLLAWLIEALRTLEIQMGQQVLRAEDLEYVRYKQDKETRHWAGLLLVTFTPFT